VRGGKLGMPTKSRKLRGKSIALNLKR